MKFINQLLSLLAFTVSVYSNTIPQKKLYTRGIDERFDINIIPNQQCRAELSEYSECFADEVSKTSITLKGIREYCEAANTEKCQQFYKDGLVPMESCRGLPDDVVNQFNDNFINFKTKYITYCIEGEKHEACPIALIYNDLYFLNDDLNLDMNYVHNITQETCTSKACTEATIKALDLFNEDTQLSEAYINSDNHLSINIGKIREITNYLKSEECSGSESLVKFIKSSILFTFGLVFFLI